MSNLTDSKKQDLTDSAMQEAAAGPETTEDKLQRLAQFIVKGEDNRNKYLKKYHDHLKRYMESKHGLLDTLMSEEVIDEEQMAEIKGTGTGEKTVYKQNAELIEILRKVPDDKYLKFLEALAVRQEDLVETLTDKQWKQPALPSNR